MERTRELTRSEKKELIYALSIARRKNEKHARDAEFAALEAKSSAEQQDLGAECINYQRDAETDSFLIDMLINGQIVVSCDEEATATGRDGEANSIAGEDYDA